MLKITFSNRFESLLDSLLDAIAEPSESPFSSDQIIIPSTAIRRRLELAAADRFGICANVQFSFLAQWLWRQIAQVVPVGEVSPFTPPVLSWRVFEILGDSAFAAEHPPLASYLRSADALMRYDLALRTATLFDQYITYRPDWLAVWSDGRMVALPETDGPRLQNEHWQAALWRRLMHELGTRRQHPSAAFFAAIEAAGSEAPRRVGLPTVAHVFCLPTTPPLYIKMLRQLGRWVDLRLYVLNPCREYWFDIVDPRRLSYLAARGEAAHHEVGNRLLAAWGKQSQAHLALLFDDAGEASVDDDRFDANPATTLLAHLQNTMLDLRELEPGSHSALAPDDRSVEVHVCHSLTRELEVLQDQLLATFAGDDPPRPADSLVVTPSLEEAAPLIDAVFGNATGARRIPYTITGRGRSTVNPAARALVELLTVAKSRFQASAVFELLQQPIVARCFGIDGSALDQIHGWIRDSAIRWGIDAKHREHCGLPPFARHTFDDGLHRLYLGYALPSAVASPLANRLPTSHPEGGDALALGCFWNFVRQLERLQREVAQPKAPAEWAQTLFGIITTFLRAADDEIEDLREIEAAIGELHENMRHGGATAPLALDVVHAALQALLDDPARGGVPTGAVTFSSMTSLRNLPYRVICAIGLNDGAFPRATRPAEFDLMSIAPRPGDRQRRADDRNVFLDLVLAARERLYLSYVGRSVRDNSSLPPSVLIAELLDYLVPAIASDAASPDALAAARKRLIVEHPLQPFSIAYFTADGDRRLKSFNDEYCDALKEQLTEPAEIAPTETLPDDEAEADAVEVAEPVQLFFRAPLAQPGDEWCVLTIDQLTRFFRNPSRYLLRQRLGVELAQGDEELRDEEPFLPDWPGRTALAERLLPAYRENRSAEQIRALAHAGTEYPPGRLGEMLLDRELQHLDVFAQGLARDTAAPCLPPVQRTLEFLVDGEVWQLTGELGDLRPKGLVRHRYDDVRAFDYLTGWITHLFLNAMLPAGVTPQTIWHSRDGRYVLRPYAAADKQLRALLALYRRGLRAPLHFFRKSAWDYMTNGENLDKAAAKAWRSTRDQPFREDCDAAYRLALRGQPDPLDEEFVECAGTVFGPLLDSIDDPRLGP